MQCAGGCVFPPGDREGSGSTKGFRLADRKGSGSAVEFLEEATAVTGVTGADGLLDFEQEHIPVAIHKPAHDPLEVAAGFALQPELLAGPAPVVHEPGFECLLQGFVIEPGEHQNTPGGVIAAGRFLHDGGNESVGCKFEIEFHSCRLAFCQIIRNNA